MIKIDFRPLRHSASPTLLFIHVQNIRATLNKPSHGHEYMEGGLGNLFLTSPS